MISAIIEIAKDHHGNSRIRLKQALSELKKYGIKDYHMCNPGEQCYIPDFGHDHKCQCLDPEPYGVQRYFDLYLEWPNFDGIFDPIRINDYAVLIPCEKKL